MDTLEGTLERIVYQDADTRWTVARLASTAHKEPVTIVGNLAGVAVGAAVRLQGKWGVDRKYGEQFKVERYQPIVPATAAGIEKYLGSGLIPGIGPELAHRIVEHFGANTLEVLEKEPERLREVEGIGRVRAERIRGGLGEQREIQDVFVFLQGHGVSPAFAARIYKKYGASAISVVRENPYRLALDVWGIGFRTADTIAQRLGIEKTSPARAEAGLLHALGEIVEEGNVHAPQHELLAHGERLLEIGEDILGPAIERLVASGHLVREELGDRGECLYLRTLWEQETRVAAQLAALGAIATLPIEIDVEKALEWFEKDRDIALASQQREAIRAAIRDKLVVITGGPGVGKTTIVNGIIRILEKKQRRIVLAAPTGRAAKRLTETTGRPAKTVHRLLEFNPRTGSFERNETQPLEADLVIVDEASMLDLPLMASLVAAVPKAAQLVLVGDVDQLPSVGPGRILADVIASKRATVVKLTEIFRQASQSSIVLNAHRINRGELPELSSHEGSDFFFVERDEPTDALATILELAAERIPRRFGLDPVNDVQILTPMHRGDVGAQNLNLALQGRLNPAGPGKTEIARGARVFRVGDKVMQIRNDYDKEVFNGDVGRIVEISADLATASDPSGEATPRGLVVEIDGRPVIYEGQELDQLVHAYALSVHKAQGSEYPAVVIPVVTQHFMLLQRNLLYTAVTRGKRLVVLVGSRKALGIALRNDDTKLRWTWLARRLRDAPTVPS